MHPRPPENLIEVYQVAGGTPLTGSIGINGSKNAALPIIISSLLTAEPVTLHNVPRISDVDIILEIVASLGTSHTWIGKNSLLLVTPNIWSVTPPPSLILRMRASFELWGALLGRAGEGNLSMPGGCNIGARPVDQHVSAFQQLGHKVTEDDGYFKAVRTTRRLPNEVRFDFPTVGGTRNTIMAATIGSGHVVLKNASTEPEVEDMIGFLNALGARISIVDPETIEVVGVDRLRGGNYTVIPDRMEAGTYMIAAAATRGCVTLHNANAHHLRPVALKLTEAGVRVHQIGPGAITVDARNSALRPLEVDIAEYPGFPTDLHPLMTSLFTTIAGISRTRDRVFPERFTHVPQLTALGARISINGLTTEVTGGSLTAGRAHATDLRAGGALVVAALIAQGESTISGLEFINRGYQDLHLRLRQIGADISLQRVPARHMIPETLSSA